MFLDVRGYRSIGQTRIQMIVQWFSGWRNVVRGSIGTVWRKIREEREASKAASRGATVTNTEGRSKSQDKKRINWRRRYDL
jgi:hypothetical protein